MLILLLLFYCRLHCTEDLRVSDVWNLEICAVNASVLFPGEPPMTGTATIFVTVGDINDNAPVFREAYAPVVAADAVIGEEVIRFYASDADLPINGPPFNFELECNDVVCQAFKFEFEQGELLWICYVVISV